VTRKLLFHLRTQVLTGVAILLAGLFVPAPAQAQIPSNGVYYACVRLDRDGDEGRLVRLVGASEACRRNETKISWNQQGAAGPQGPAGVAGPAGAAGPKGDKGAAGDPGAAGAGVTVTPIASGAGCGPVAGVLVTDGNGHSELVCDGAAGPKGDKGDTGDNAQGVIAEGSSGGGTLTTPYSTPNPGAPSTVLGGTVVVTKPVTGFRGYMVWGNAAIQFQASYSSQGTMIPGQQTATSATCTLRQGVKVGDVVTLDPTFIDVRSIQVLFPATVPATTNGQTLVQRYVISLVGDSPAPGNASDVVVAELLCGSNGVAAGATPPLQATSTSIAVIGMNGVFGLE
jgi:hypothetical protein